jgi:plasmid maintenance system antidote protein VapI
MNNSRKSAFSIIIVVLFLTQIASPLILQAAPGNSSNQSRQSAEFDKYDRVLKQTLVKNDLKASKFTLQKASKQIHDGNVQQAVKMIENEVLARTISKEYGKYGVEAGVWSLNKMVRDVAVQDMNGDELKQKIQSSMSKYITGKETESSAEQARQQGPRTTPSESDGKSSSRLTPPSQSGGSSGAASNWGGASASGNKSSDLTARRRQQSRVSKEAVQERLEEVGNEEAIQKSREEAANLAAGNLRAQLDQSFSQLSEKSSKLADQAQAAAKKMAENLRSKVRGDVKKSIKSSSKQLAANVKGSDQSTVDVTKTKVLNNNQAARKTLQAGFKKHLQQKGLSEKKAGKQAKAIASSSRANGILSQIKSARSQGGPGQSSKLTTIFNKGFESVKGTESFKESLAFQQSVVQAAKTNAKAQGLSKSKRQAIAKSLKSDAKVFQMGSFLHKKNNGNSSEAFVSRSQAIGTILAQNVSEAAQSSNLSTKKANRLGHAVNVSAQVAADRQRGKSVQESFKGQSMALAVADGQVQLASNVQDKYLNPESQSANSLKRSTSTKALQIGSQIGKSIAENTPLDAENLQTNQSTENPKQAKAQTVQSQKKRNRSRPPTSAQQQQPATQSGQAQEQSRSDQRQKLLEKARRIAEEREKQSASESPSSPPASPQKTEPKKKSSVSEESVENQSLAESANPTTSNEGNQSSSMSMSRVIDKAYSKDFGKSYSISKDQVQGNLPERFEKSHGADKGQEASYRENKKKTHLQVREYEDRYVFQKDKFNPDKGGPMNKAKHAYHDVAKLSIEKYGPVKGVKKVAEYAAKYGAQKAEKNGLSGVAEELKNADKALDKLNLSKISDAIENGQSAKESAQNVLDSVKKGKVDQALESANESLNEARKLAKTAGQDQLAGDLKSTSNMINKASAAKQDLEAGNINEALEKSQGLLKAAQETVSGNQKLAEQFGAGNQLIETGQELAGEAGQLAEDVKEANVDQGAEKASEVLETGEKLAGQIGQNQLAEKIDRANQKLNELENSRENIDPNNTITNTVTDAAGDMYGNIQAGNDIREATEETYQQNSDQIGEAANRAAEVGGLKAGLDKDESKTLGNAAEATNDVAAGIVSGDELGEAIQNNRGQINNVAENSINHIMENGGNEFVANAKDEIGEAVAEQTGGAVSSDEASALMNGKKVTKGMTRDFGKNYRATADYQKNTERMTQGSDQRKSEVKVANLGSADFTMSDGASIDQSFEPGGAAGALSDQVDVQGEAKYEIGAKGKASLGRSTYVDETGKTHTVDGLKASGEVGATLEARGSVTSKKSVNLAGQDVDLETNANGYAKAGVEGSGQAQVGVVDGKNVGAHVEAGAFAGVRAGGSVSQSVETAGVKATAGASGDVGVGLGAQGHADIQVGWDGVSVDAGAGAYVGVGGSASVQASVDPSEAVDNAKKAIDDCKSDVVGCANDVDKAVNDILNNGKEEVAKLKEDLGNTGDALGDKVDDAGRMVNNILGGNNDNSADQEDDSDDYDDDDSDYDSDEDESSVDQSASDDDGAVDKLVQSLTGGDDNSSESSNDYSNDSEETNDGIQSNSGDPSQGPISSTVDNITDSANDIASSAAETGQEIVDQGSDWIDDQTDKAEEVGSDIQDAAEDAASSAADAVCGGWNPVC